ALKAFAGGEGILALVFFGLALVGLYAVYRRSPAFAGFTLLALAAVPVLMVLPGSDDDLTTRLSPRPPTFGLPSWTRLGRVGVARLVRNLPALAVVAVVVAVGVAGTFAPAGIADPRVDPDQSEAVLAAPADFVREQMADGTVLFPYSPVFLEALDETEKGI